MSKKSIVSVCLRSVFFVLLVVTAFGFALTASPSTAAAASLSIRLSDGGCGTNAGPLGTASASGTSSDWSGWVTDSNGYDSDCATVNLSGITENMDFRVGIQLSDDGCSASGGQDFTPWASTGGGFSGWSTDSNSYDPDCARVYLETRPAPAGASIRNPRVELQASDQACSAQLGSLAAGSWVTDGNGYDFDCLRLNLVADVVPLGKVTVQTQAFDKDGNLVSYKPAVSWGMSGPSGAPSCNGSSSTGKTCERMPYGWYTVNPSTTKVSNYELIGVSVSERQLLGTESPPAGVCPSGQAKPHLEYNSSGSCTSVDSCGVSECSLGGGGGDGGGMDRQLNSLPSPSIFSRILNIFTREAEARIICEDDVCDTEPTGPVIVTPPPPDEPPPEPVQIFFTIQYKEIASTNTLTVTKTGSGSVNSTSPVSPSISCGSICSANYASGQVVNLSAVPSANYSVTWSGCSTSSGNSCSVTMTGNKTVTAAFNLEDLPTSPTVTNPTATSITSSSATLGATLASAGNPAPVTGVGFCYSTSSSALNSLPSSGVPSSTSSRTCTPATVPAVGSTFSKGVTGFSASTTYYHKGYATNSTGTGYSPAASFTTPRGLIIGSAGACANPQVHYACLEGTSIDNVETSTAWTWGCRGSNGTVASCSEPKSTGTAINGLCGTTHNDCVRGTSTNTPDTSSYYRWQCNGLNGGSAVSCSEKKYVDLKAGNPTPATATVNVAKEFSATISNEGSISSSTYSSTFPVIFQTSPSPTGASGVADYRVTPDMTALTPDSSATAKKSITFSAAGTMYIRACADKSSATNNGVVTEVSPGSEDNNCSAWTRVDVSTTSGTVNGYHDQYTGSVPATQCQANGWAAYSANKLQDLNVRILSDGVQVATAVAGTYRADLKAAADSGHPTVCTDGTCAFSIDLNGKISAGVNHSITAQAQNPATNAWTNLTSTPKTINCAAPLAKPDLTAGAVTPITTTANVSTTFSATITNSGNASAGTYVVSGGGGSVYHVFQYDEDSDHNSGVSNVAVATSSPIAANGGTKTISNSHTFTTSGTKYIRACADNNASMTGTIAESNSQGTGETNNCGPWTTITVSPSNPVVTNVTISSTAVVPDGSTPYTITVVGTNPGGGSNITHEYALVNFQGANAAYRRGYVTWYYNSAYTGWNTYKDKLSCMGGGVAAIQPGYGAEYIELAGCNTQVSGNTRTTTFTVAFNPIFTAPTTQNDISGYVQASGINTGWINFDLNFGLASKDLVAASVSPTSADEGKSTNFTASISNAGTIGTGASFPYFFQIASAANGGGTISGLASKTMSALGGGAAAPASQAYTPEDPGTFSMRVCADKTNAAGGGVIAESNEDNNCGAWTNIIVSEDNDPEDDKPTSIGVDSVTINASTVKTDGTYYNITVVGHRKKNGSLLNNQYALINIQGGNAGAYRGFLTWYRLSDAWPNAQDKRTCSGVGGYAAVQDGDDVPGNDKYGHQYIHLDSCNVTDNVANGITTTIFTVHFTPLFTSPVTGNDISGLVCDGASCTSWTNFDINFGLDIAQAGAGGVCAAAHYGCVTGTSTENKNESSAWTWKCVGAGDEPTATCTEIKPKPTFEEN